jgi:hypothetical protein
LNVRKLFSYLASMWRYKIFSVILGGRHVVPRYSTVVHPIYPTVNILSILLLYTLSILLWTLSILLWTSYCCAPYLSYCYINVHPIHPTVTHPICPAFVHLVYLTVCIPYLSYCCTPYLSNGCTLIYPADVHPMYHTAAHHTYPTAAHHTYPSAVRSILLLYTLYPTVVHLLILLLHTLPILSLSTLSIQYSNTIMNVHYSLPPHSCVPRGWQRGTVDYSLYICPLYPYLRMYFLCILLYKRGKGIGHVFKYVHTCRCVSPPTATCF